MSRPRANPPLTPEQVLERHHAGPKSGVFTDGACEGNERAASRGGQQVIEGPNERPVQRRGAILMPRVNAWSGDGGAWSMSRMAHAPLVE